MMQRLDVPLEQDDRAELDGMRAIYRELGGTDLEKRHLLRRFSSQGEGRETGKVRPSLEIPVRRKTLTFDAVTIDLIEEEVRKALHSAVGGRGRHSAAVVPANDPGDFFAFDLLAAEVIYRLRR